MQRLTVIGLAAVVLGGCTAIAGSTNTLTDERIKSETAGALGYPPADVTIVSRRTEGVNTYVSLLTVDKHEYSCIINGGNLLTMGMINPPMCSRKGEPIKATPF